MKTITIEISAELEAALEYHMARNAPPAVDEVPPVLPTGMEYLEARFHEVTQSYLESFQAGTNQDYFEKLQSLPKPDRDEVRVLIQSKYDALPEPEVELK